MKLFVQPAVTPPSAYDGCSGQPIWVVRLLKQDAKKTFSFASTVMVEVANSVLTKALSCFV